ncbi:MAG: HD domain-containing protein, partial [Bacteroidales bacterium]|nr:HD domain-containing protein [Bacteroidales bacterium]
MKEYIENLFPRYDEAGKEMILKAYNIADEALKEHKRSNGNPFIEHPVAVARIACDEIGLSAECIAAVFLHEATRFFPETEIPKGAFGQDVMTLVDGLNKISTINPKDTRLEAENYKKLIVSYSKDPRVTVLKIADRLEVMRSLDMFPKLSRERKVLETMMLYIPLAHQLGLYNIKSEMEDIYFRHADPEQYRAITNKLKSTERDRQKLMTQFIEPLKQKLSDEGISYKLKVRTKTALSIYKKMQKQKVSFEGVFDVFAIRFIIDCEADRETEHALCWKVFSYVTEEYES